MTPAPHSRGRARVLATEVRTCEKGHEFKARLVQRGRNEPVWYAACRRCRCTTRVHKASPEIKAARAAAIAREAHCDRGRDVELQRARHVHRLTYLEVLFLLRACLEPCRTSLQSMADGAARLRAEVAAGRIPVPALLDHDRRSNRHP